MTDGDLNPPEWADNESWRAGFATAMGLVQSAAGEYAEAAGADGGPETDPEPNEDECPNCGGRLIEEMGSKDPVCLNCDV